MVFFYSFKGSSRSGAQRVEGTFRDWRERALDLEGNVGERTGVESACGIRLSQAEK